MSSVKRFINTTSQFCGRYVVKGAAAYLWLAFLSAFLSVGFIYAIYKNVIDRQGVLIAGTLTLVLIAAAACALGYIKELTVRRFVFLAFIAAFALRVFYVAYTAAEIRQHDADVCHTYTVMSNGHFGIMMTIYKTGKLPVTNDYQAYHPPLMHLLGAGVLKFGDLINVQIGVRCEMLQILPLFFTSSMMLVMIKIIKRLKLSEPMETIAILLSLFQPHGIILSGSINNDPLMWLLFCVSILYLLRWNENPTMFNIVMIALSLGLGMMTKMSAALMIPVIAVVFVLKSIKNFKTMSGDLYAQFAVFLILSVPLGMWYPARNYVLFGQPLNYVLTLPTGSVLYSGDVPVWQRFAIDLTDLFKNLFVDVHDRNVWVFMLKSASFDEMKMSAVPPQAVAVVVLNIVFIFATVPAIVCVMIKERRFDFCILCAVWMILIGSFIKFSIDYPYLCTSNFRYIYPTAMIGAVFIARACELLRQKAKWVGYSFAGISALFVLFTCISYLSRFMIEY